MRFCGYCGTALPLVCLACGGTVPPGMRFCGHCGASLAGFPSSTEVNTTAPALPLASPVASTQPNGPSSFLAPAPEERRLVTALFCDLVGFTPLAEQLDPEEVRDFQAAYFAAMAEQIERYGGIVEKYAGDAVLALFGVPLAHEDDAERAVLCALGMQIAIEPVAATIRARWQLEPAIRVGVNTGEVVSGAWNASGRQDVAVTGDAVNTAARLQAAAEPGEVLVGLETMRLTRRRIRYGEHRDVTLKGKAETVPVHPALGLRERFGERWETNERATPLVGRDREMVELLDIWLRAQAGEGQLVTVIGDAGVGKSRLIAELLDKVIAGSAIRTVRARCLSYGQGISLWLIADLLRSLFGIGEEDALDEMRARLFATLPVLLTLCSADSQAEALDVLGEVLGLPPANSLGEHAGAEIRRQALIRSMKLILGALAERAPTVLILEDMHWVDEASQSVLKAVLSDVPGLRLLALLAQRPGWTATWSEWSWTDRLTVRPLRESDARLLAEAVLGGVPLARELDAFVGERAGGNPYFVEEILRALAESGGLVQRDGVMSLATGGAEWLPSTLTEVLLARLDRLEGPVREVAQVASVIGRSFLVRLLAQVMKREAAALELPLFALQQAEIAFPRRGSDLAYVFKHAGMREATYNTLVQRRRQQLHLETARAIAMLYPSDEYVEVIAYHYARTGEDTEAAVWLERAGDRAAGIYAGETATAHYEEARRRRELTGSEPTDLARLDEKLGETLFTAGRYDEAVSLLDRAVEAYQEARDLECAGRAAALLGRAHGLRGTGKAGLARVESMVELLTLSGPSAALASLHLALAQLFQLLGRYEEMLKTAEQASGIARSIGHDHFLAWAEERHGAAFTLLGQAEQARSTLQGAIPLLERVGDLSRLQIALANLAEACRIVGELEEAERRTEQALQVAERVGNPSYIAFDLMSRGEIRLFSGRWEEAREDLERAEALVGGPTSARTYAAYPPSMLGQFLLWAGDWEGAETHLERALRLAESASDWEARALVHVSLAELEIVRGQPNAAIARLEPLLGWPGISRIACASTLAWAYQESGNLERAVELASEAVKRAREQGEAIALVDAMRVEGMVRMAQGRQEAAAKVLTEALHMAHVLPYPYAEARILERLGKLEEALAIFQRLGARKDIERTEGTLAEVTRP